MSAGREEIQPIETNPSNCNRKPTNQSATSLDPSVCIVILNYDDWAMTKRCLTHLSRLEYSNYRIIVVDNGSRDPCPEGMPVCFPKIEFLYNHRNIGYAQGCNRGICHARKWNPDYLWLLNNDTEVDPRSLTAMARMAESNLELGAVGSVLCDPGIEGTVQAWGGGSISFLTGLPKHLKCASGKRLDYICGASILIRVAALDKIGLLDPQLFLYWEDADLCLRLRAAGWRLGVANASRVVHRGSATAHFRSVLYDYHFTHSSVRFYRRHCRHWWWPAAVSLAGRMTKRALCGRTKNSKAVLAGFRDAIGNAGYTGFHS